MGFDDLELAAGGDPIGEALAGELRSSLTRTAGLRVLGPETSKMLRMSGENRYTVAKELLVTAPCPGRSVTRWWPHQGERKPGWRPGRQRNMVGPY